MRSITCASLLTLRVDKQPVEQLQSQQLMDLGGVVLVSFKVATYHSFQTRSLDVRPGECPVIQEHFTNVFRKLVPIPDPEMQQLMPAKEESFKAKRGEKMIDASDPLRHAVVIGIFRFKSELQE